MARSRHLRVLALIGLLAAALAGCGPLLLGEGRRHRDGLQHGQPGVRRRGRGRHVARRPAGLPELSIGSIKAPLGPVPGTRLPLARPGSAPA
jgi:hypothetical protein